MKEGKSAAPNDLENRITSIIKAVYLKGRKDKKFRLDRESSLVKDLGFDSVEVLELIVKIEQEMAIKIPDDYLRAEYFETTSSVMRTIESLLAGGEKNGTL